MEGVPGDMCRRESRARGQEVHGKEVWPEHWGLSRSQLKQLLRRLQEDPRWNPENDVYKLVGDFVIPWTQGKGVGYALLMNMLEPKEVNVMVSHAWGENAEEFLRAVLRATAEDDIVYICALANYQAEDGAGPSLAEQIGTDPTESPFRRVLQHIKAKGSKAGGTWRLRPFLLKVPVVLVLLAMCLLCAPVVAWMVEQRLWRYDPVLAPQRVHIIFQWLPYGAALASLALLAHCALERHVGIYPGRMLVVPNRESDIYHRLWCVYEIFVASCLRVHIELAPTLAPAGRASTRDAVCSQSTDAQRIRHEIVKTCNCGGFDKVDRAVRHCMRNVKWHTAGVWMKYVVLFVAPACVGPFQDLSLALLSVAVSTVVVLGLAISARLTHGVFRPDGPAFWASFLSVAVNLALMLAVTSKDGASWSAQVACIVMRDTSSFAIIFLAANCRPFPVFFGPRWRIPVLAVLFLARFASILGMSAETGLHEGVEEESCLGVILVDVCIFAGALVCPLYMGWTESLHWGMEFRGLPRHPRITGAIAWIGTCVWAFFFLRFDLWLNLLKR